MTGTVKTENMGIADIAGIINGKMVNPAMCLNENIDIQYAFASDLMSDVLTLNIEHLLLITGLANVQTIRTAEMADISCIVLARNKKATPEMIEMAEKSGIILLECKNSMFKISGELYKAGVKPVY